MIPSSGKFDIFSYLFRSKRNTPKLPRFAGGEKKTVFSRAGFYFDPNCQSQQNSQTPIGPAWSRFPESFTPLATSSLGSPLRRFFCRSAKQQGTGTNCGSARTSAPQSNGAEIGPNGAPFTSATLIGGYSNRLLSLSTTSQQGPSQTIYRWCAKQETEPLLSRRIREACSMSSDQL